MGHVRQMGHVDISPDRAFALTMDAKRDPEWNSSVVEVKDVTGMLDTVGAHYTAMLKLGGRQLETRWEVMKVEKPRLLEQEATSDRGGHATSTTTFEPAGGGTDITIEVDYELPGGFVGGMADKLFVERAIERDIKHSIENFKAICEAEVQVPA
jgi:polyketide cyclase/dehydrase/lipid transport protein